MVAADANLSALVNPPTPFILGDRVLELTPLVMRDLPAFQQAIQPLLAAGLDLSATLDVQALLSMLLANSASATAAVALMARLEREQVEALPLDEFIRLAAACLEVNVGFFLRRVLPTLSQALEGLVPALIPPAIGSPSPPVSSATATATAT